MKELPNFKRYIQRYVQHHIALAKADASHSAPPFDGFSELWIENRSDLEELFAHPLPEALLEDERLFLDITATRWFVLDRPHIVFSRTGLFAGSGNKPERR